MGCTNPSSLYALPFVTIYYSLLPPLVPLETRKEMKRRAALSLVAGFLLVNGACPLWAGQGSPAGHASRIPVLTYHSHRVLGTTYEANDHVAFHRDLRTIHAQGFRVIPLRWVVEWVLGRRDGSTLHRSVAITFDDGPDLDYYGLYHPQYGHQRSFYNILLDFQAEVGASAQPHLHASSFVIASPAARRELDAQNLGGRGWMTDTWWKEANSSGIMSIFNHSWDHNHPDVRRVCEQDQRKGSFEVIDTYTECRCEVEQAAMFIHRKIHPAWPVVFAYPWGQSSAYVRENCLPYFRDRHHTLAAFGAGGVYVTRSSPRWNLPRFVSGAGWQTTDEFIRILDRAR